MVSFGTLLLCACASAPQVTAPCGTFYGFSYAGQDFVFVEPLPADQYQNPILAGFYADPSITRADDAFYLTVSSFSYFPGAPSFESTDLVHWQLLGHILKHPEQFNPQGVGIS